ncbi:MAG: 2-amino-4-hydroxy-6-hydroxymethyldihydropteridine diphosphokinase [Candidatus Glassbacteria bacterium GWA2_58_10]|uniref:2-amino-4-hydroxy-6-hydroxymethyldihydropteridine diphosphokinase n=1 Tax=Candidatus Glassbacteria bacterium GWA2_58_10 TaxID=1817865 RepID=A0A1F5Y9M2_9BACT|nr:MAG: 2-amino-4-hydroxy-6-hydroxymethyldihydropteridine diphosphokinase [Candidatus Glassbacteria bacterium GWA2_58_10]
MEEDVFISLGSNLGDREENLRRASEALRLLPETQVTGRSLARMTAPVGLTGQPDFLNQVQRLSTSLHPVELLKKLLQIESDLGRVRTEHWGPRIIDLDLLFYGRIERDSEFLMLPHREIWNRPFFLEMISEIDGSFLQRWKSGGAG